MTTICFDRPFNGGTVYSNSLFQAFQSIADVDLFVLRNARRFPNELIHKAVCLASAVISNTPLNVLYHSGLTNGGLPKLQIYDLIVVDHIEAYEVVRTANRPIIIIAHNLEHRLVGDKLKNATLSSLLGFREGLKSYEYSAFKKTAGVICISSIEKSVVQELNPKTVQLLPSFESYEQPARRSGKVRFGFLGPANWAPNVRTVSLLAKDIFPQVTSDFDFVVAGKGWIDSGIAFPANTRLLGFVDNTEDFWRNVDWLVSPTQHGAGVNIKICEALNAGVGVVTNSSSARAIFGQGRLPKSLKLADTNEVLISTLDELTFRKEHIEPVYFTQSALREQLSLFIESV